MCKQWKKAQVWTFFACCIADSQTDTGRHQLYRDRRQDETKQQPSRARSGHQISCCLVFLHFLCDILVPITVQQWLACPFFHSLGISYQSIKHLQSPPSGREREGRPEGRGGRPDVVILADNMKSGASSDRASNFPPLSCRCCYSSSCPQAYFCISLPIWVRYFDFIVL